jgi:hypothetical protein
MGSATALYVSYDYAATNGGNMSSLSGTSSLLSDNLDIIYKVLDNNIVYNKTMTVTYNLLGKRNNDRTYTLAAEDDVLSGDYYQTTTKDDVTTRSDTYTKISTTTKNLETGATALTSNDKATIDSDVEYYFNYAVGDIFKQSRYIPLEIEVTLTYGRNGSRTKTVRKAVIFPYFML